MTHRQMNELRRINEHQFSEKITVNIPKCVKEGKEEEYIETVLWRQWLDSVTNSNGR